MTEVAEKPKGKVKKPKPFWVMTERDGLLSRHYTGTDKGKAREKAAEILAKDTNAKVFVVKVGTLAVLTNDSLEATLPQDAF